MGRLARSDNPNMLRILGEIWLPTTIALLATAGHDNGDTHWAAVMTALLVVPFVWKSFVIRHGRPHIRRAILAGSASAFLIMWSEWMFDGVLRFIQGRHGEEGLGGLLVILIPPITLVGVLLGAGLASLAAFLQARFWPAPPEESESSDLGFGRRSGWSTGRNPRCPFRCDHTPRHVPTGRAGPRNEPVHLYSRDVADPRSHRGVGGSEGGSTLEANRR